MTKDELRVLADTWPNAEFYDCSDDVERLSHQDVLEAVEAKLGEVGSPKIPFEEALRSELGDGLTIYGWTRDEVDVKRLAEIATDAMGEKWSEEYGDPDGDDSGDFEELFPEVVKLLETHLKTHPVWRCTQTVKFEIPIDQLVEIAKLEWPEWFETNGK